MKKHTVCELNHMRFDEELKAEACGWKWGGGSVYGGFYVKLQSI